MQDEKPMVSNYVTSKPAKTAFDAALAVPAEVTKRQQVREGREALLADVQNERLRRKLERKAARRAQRTAAVLGLHDADVSHALSDSNAQSTGGVEGAVVHLTSTDEATEETKVFETPLVLVARRDRRRQRRRMAAKGATTPTTNALGHKVAPAPDTQRPARSRRVRRFVEALARKVVSGRRLSALERKFVFQLTGVNPGSPGAFGPVPGLDVASGSAVGATVEPVAHFDASALAEAARQGQEAADVKAFVESAQFGKGSRSGDAS